MKITLINPNIVTQKGDFFSSGIPYMPITLASLAGYLRSKGHDITVIDAFGEAPTKARQEGDYYVQGLTLQEITQKLPSDVEFIFTYAGLVVTHSIHKKIIRAIREQNKNTPICIIENTQSVVAYSLKNIAKEFFEAGADYIITGESEMRAEKLLNAKNQPKKIAEIDGLICKNKKTNEIIHQPKKEIIKNLDELPFPAWDLFPLQKYWQLKYSHAPFTTKKYLPLLTSRGCTWPCKFCIIPETNERKWRARSAKHVLEEIKYWNGKYGITEFHIEDLNPTINKNRITELSNLIIENKLQISWKFAAGTKIETLDKETITTAAKAGCAYVSLSPESGSPTVLKSMDKNFDHEYALELVKHMNKLGVITQACFVLGYLTETEQDLKMTKEYIKKLTRAGIDEIALFIMTPIPGSQIEKEAKIKGYTELPQLTFSPNWRPDYAKLNKFRWNTYMQYILLKAVYHPIKLLQQPFRIITKRFKTKMEMTVYRAVKLAYLTHKNQQN